MAFTVADGLVRLVVDDKTLAKSITSAGANAGATTGGATLGTRFVNAFSKIALPAGAAAGGALARSIGKATDFDQQLRVINTVAKVSDDALHQIGQGILDVSKETGKATDDLTSGFYDLVSAGVPADKALQVLRTSAILATGALGTTGEAVDLMTSALNAYGLSADKAGRVSDIFAQAVADGKVTVAELGGTISQIAPLAASAGVSLEEVAAGFAVLTAKGTPAAQAATEMRAAISALLTPNTELNALQTQTGKNFAELAKTEGLARALEEIRKATNGDNDAFAKALGSVEGYQFALAATGDNAASFATEQDKVTTAADQGGVAMGQYEEVMKGAAAQGQRLTAQLSAAAIEIGGPFVSSLGAVLSALGPVGQGLSGVAAGAGLAKAGLKGIGGILNALVGPATTLASLTARLGASVASAINDLPGVPAIKAAGTKLGNFLGSTMGKAFGFTLAIVFVAWFVDEINKKRAEVAAALGDISGNVANQVATGTTAQLTQSRDALKTAIEAIDAHTKRGPIQIATPDEIDALKGLVEQYNIVQTELNLRAAAAAKASTFAIAGAVVAGQPVVARATAELAMEIPKGIQKNAAFAAAAAKQFLALPIGRQLVVLGATALRAGAQTSLDLADGLRQNRDGVTAAMKQLASDIKNALSPKKIVARDVGFLIGKTLADGLYSSDPIVKKQAQGTRGLIEAELVETVKGGGSAGAKIMASLAADLKSKDPHVRAQAARTKSLIDAAMKDKSAGKKPGDAIAEQLSSDLASANTPLGKTAYSIGRTIATNLLRGVRGDGPLTLPIATGHFAGKPIPLYETGAWATQEGLAYLHDDEMVVPRKEARAIRAGTSGLVPNVSAPTTPNVTLVMPDARNHDPFAALERARRYAGFGAFSGRPLSAPVPAR